MRIWSVHPKYLDTKGLLGQWREALLCRAVLEGKTKGFTKHPQLIRFRQHPQGLDILADYLAIVYDEGIKRGFKMDRSKIGESSIDYTSSLPQHSLHEKKSTTSSKTGMKKALGRNEDEPHENDGQNQSKGETHGSSGGSNLDPSVLASRLSERGKRVSPRISVPVGQLAYEWYHMKQKLKRRDPERLKRNMEELLSKKKMWDPSGKLVEDGKMPEDPKCNLSEDVFLLPDLHPVFYLASGGMEDWEKGEEDYKGPEIELIRAMGKTNATEDNSKMSDDQGTNETGHEGSKTGVEVSEVGLKSKRRKSKGKDAQHGEVENLGSSIDTKRQPAAGKGEKRRRGRPRKSHEEESDAEEGG